MPPGDWVTVRRLSSAEGHPKERRVPHAGELLPRAAVAEGTLMTSTNLPVFSEAHSFSLNLTLPFIPHVQNC